jgi:CBS domain-containing protein
MSLDPVSISADGQLVDVVDSLMANDFRRIFIHEGEKLVGLISRSDLMPAILEALIERT